MRMVLIMIACAMDFLFAGCSKAQDHKMLIVYLTRTKNTQAVARMIQQDTGAEMVALELVHPYPKDYQAQVAQVAREHESGFLPALKVNIDSIERYDVIFIGFPTWGMKMPPPMRSFLRQYNLAGKIVVPFNTNAGYGVGSGFEEVKALCRESKVLEGFSVKGGIERDGVFFVMEGERERQVSREVKEWLGRIGLLPVF